MRVVGRGCRGAVRMRGRQSVAGRGRACAASAAVSGRYCLWGMRASRCRCPARRLLPWPCRGRRGPASPPGAPAAVVGRGGRGRAGCLRPRAGLPACTVCRAGRVRFALSSANVQGSVLGCGCLGRTNGGSLNAFFAYSCFQFCQL